MTDPRPLTFQPPGQRAADHVDDGDELARAELYGLLARLWQAPPDEALLAALQVAVTEAPQAGAWLETPWQALVGLLRQTPPAQIAAEYEALFGGVGRPEVFLYASYHLAGHLNELPLAQLRAALAELGLARAADSGETEDHIAFVLEVMRWLIAGDDAAHCHLGGQARFFRAHLQPWAGALCEAVAAHPGARVYRALADFTNAFVQVETQAFDLAE
ncbi:TorD/DmsD family molecular chaperone [Sphaerotilus microaerophilus]|uniref:Molecular chaperone n=1 Tax=Sphaerotilus microaerophilus TaxID=2914710 RepID=A0ABN6PRT6_9BURK|nr:molecular chaperone TorD family protein [Sphaerotilus sp. FB-5]BDI06787.1 hypothetical protein CATMQ487_37570 [Sphaerotilus sp. FB-5]